MRKNWRILQIRHFRVILRPRGMPSQDIKDFCVQNAEFLRESSFFQTNTPREVESN